MRAIPVRFFTATGLLMRLRSVKREDRLDAEPRQIAKARFPIIDEFGYMPIDEEGSRLLFQVISDSYETRSVIYTTNIEFSVWGACKTELVWRREPFQGLRDLELATFRWVSWWNSKRLHQSLGYRTPQAVETEYYANQAAQAASL